MHPLDLIKTRLQIQGSKPVGISPKDPKYYNGIIDCMMKMQKHEGILSLWKGILPPILVETPKRAVKVKYNDYYFVYILYNCFFLFT